MKIKDCDFILGVIGPSRIEKNAQILGQSAANYAKHIKEIARSAAELGIKKIAIVPNKGSSSEIFTNEFKHTDGKIIGIVPLEDKEFGISHLNQKICNEIIDCSTWRNSPEKMNEICDVFLCMGFGCGVLNEIALSKWFNKNKAKKKRILICKWLVSGKLPKEIEKDVNLIYCSNIAQLRQRLKEVAEKNLM